ncbi:MAG: GH92 family glycosyl hydrolase [Saprospiraceae bacterium]
MKNLIYLTFLILPIFFLSNCTHSTDKNASLVDFVNPFIGTGGHGHTYPGATVPFGMVQLSPDTRLEGWDGCSGYHYTDSIIYGFSHTHLSGTGIPDYGDVLLMPFTGPAIFKNGANGGEGYRSPFKKESEKAAPGYYEVHLDKPNVDVKLTATERTGYHQYHFNHTEKDAKSGKLIGSLMLDLTHRDKTLDAGLKMNSLSEIEGYRISQAWAEEQPVYFVMQFSDPILVYEIDSFRTQIRPQMFKNPYLKMAIHFELPEDKTVEVKVGISAVSTEGARANLKAETQGWDFEKVKKEASEKWETQLSKIKADFSKKDDKVNFYTALYHSSIVPNIYSDVDGQYRGLDRQIHQDTSQTKYTVFSLWDTYRATHPLFTLLETKRTNDFIGTFLNHYEEGGRLPIWELWGNETNCMIGYHAVSVISDAYQKGIKDYDADKALEAMVAFAEKDEFGKRAYIDYGYISSEKEAESVSKTLEYSYNDWCIAQMAKAMGKDEIAQTFSTRSNNWKNLFDPSTGFFRAKKNNFWFSPFNPYEVNFHYTEANAWQYAFACQHDLQGLADLFEGNGRNLESRLDSLYTVDNQTTGRIQADITGLIGQYAHGNEPSHHIAYAYNYLGAPAKTQKMIRQIMSSQYQNQPDGLAGNEDCGQMSSWMVLNALGIYQTAPGNTKFDIGSPLVNDASIHLENGKTISIKANNQSDKNVYVADVKWNGNSLPSWQFDYKDLMQGGTLEFEMTSNEGAVSKKEKSSQPKIEADFVAVPAISNGKIAFFEKDTLSLNHPNKDAAILYSLDKATDWQTYTEPFEIGESTLLFAKAKVGDKESRVIETNLLKIPEVKSLSLLTDYAPQYAAGGPNALIDYIKGGLDFRSGEWQGYEGENLEAVIDFGKEKMVKKAKINFFQDENAWIFMPLEVQFFGSKDGENFKSIGKEECPITWETPGQHIHTFSAKVNAKYRYIKVIGVNRKDCPKGHKSEGGQCWVFADEFWIE